MRQIFLSLLIAASFGNSTTFTDSSSKYKLWVTETPAGSSVQYDIRLTDANTTVAVKTWRLTTTIGTPVQMKTNDDNLQYTLRVDPREEGLRVFLLIMNGQKWIDAFDTYWDKRSPMTSENVARVGGDVRAPVPLTVVDPLYNDEARKNRISGIVIAEVLVDKTGVVRQVRVLKPLPYGLNDSAIDALRQWTFQPATRDGQPVDAVFNLTVQFKLK